MSESPRFAHASEAELARILDYYKVEWRYEPHTFPIRWNSDGMVVVFHGAKRGIGCNVGS